MDKRVTAADVARLVGAAVPSAHTLQIRTTRLWLTEQDEPFAEIDLHDRGRLASVRFSIHCTPGWAGIVVAHLAREVDVVVAPTCFIQTHKGAVLYDAEAERYWRTYKRLSPLLSARFKDPPS